MMIQGLLSAHECYEDKELFLFNFASEFNLIFPG